MYLEKEVALAGGVEAGVSARLDRLPPTRYFRGPTPTRPTQA